MVCSVGELDIPIGGAVVVRAVAFMRCRLAVRLVVTVRIVRSISVCLVLARCTVDGRRFVIAMIRSPGAIAFVTAYTWLVSTSGHTPWF
jgi:ABC-type sulfate transport system permease subunit